MNLRKILTSILLILVGTASAEVTSGFYRIRSNSYAGRYISENRSDMTLVTSSLNESNYAQVWSLNVNGNNVSIMNALTERYVQKATGNAWSVQYTTGTPVVTFTLGESDGTVYFGDKWNGGPHCAASQSYAIDLGGIITAINSVEDKSCTTDKGGSIVYDLGGRRINDPKHSIYIVNGKKVLE